MCILMIHNVLKYWSYSLKNANNICVGRRKSSIARVLYKRGNGKLVINGTEVLEYFKRESLVMMLNQPFDLVEFDKKYDFLINVISYTEFDTFVNDKIKNHLFDDDVIYNDSSIIIGESLSEKYNISIGDTILLSDIVNINVVTGNYISEKFIVANIFKFKFLNFDYENVFINENDNSFLKAEDYNIYFDKDYRNNIDSNQYEIDEMIESGNKYSSLISSIQFEKKLYVLLGILTIIISSVMMFNNTLMVLLEKRRQFSLLNNIGIGLNKMLFAILLLNIILSLCLAVFGILTTFFIEKLNYQFNIIDYLFMYSPFDSIPMNLSSNQCITTLLLIIILTAISTILSIYNIKHRLEEG